MEELHVCQAPLVIFCSLVLSCYLDNDSEKPQIAIGRVPYRPEVNGRRRRHQPWPVFRQRTARSVERRCWWHELPKHRTRGRRAQNVSTVV